MQMWLQVFIEKHNTIILCANLYTFKLAAGRQQNPIWITNMFAVITDMMKTRKI